MGSRIRRFAAFAIGFLISTGIGILGLEVSLRLVYGAGFTSQPVDTFFRNDLLAGYLDLLKKDCFGDPEGRQEYHLEFGPMWRRVGECYSWASVNTHGFRDSREFPDQRDPEFFSILVLGGSVAQHFSESNVVGGSYFERYLNARYAAAGNRKIRVFSGAISGAMQPSPFFVFHRFGDRFDAVLLLDGANEIPFLASKSMIDSPMRMPFILQSRLVNEIPQYRFELHRFFQRNGRRFEFLRRFLLWHALKELNRRDLDNQIGEIEKSESFEERFERFYRWEKGNPGNYYVELNSRRLAKYSLSFHVLSKAIGIKSAHFLQPIAAIGKELTPEERPDWETPGYQGYRIIEKTVLDATKGMPTYSLLDVFKDVKEQIYIDRVHYQVFKGESKGYAIVADAIAAKIAKPWGLKKLPVR